MAITLYVGGKKSVYEKGEKSSDKSQMDPDFEAAALASEKLQSHLREFLNERANERGEQRSKRAQAERERVG